MFEICDESEGWLALHQIAFDLTQGITEALAASTWPNSETDRQIGINHLYLLN